MKYEDIARQLAVINYDERLDSVKAQNRAYARRKEMQEECAKLGHIVGPGVSSITKAMLFGGPTGFCSICGADNLPQQG